MIWNGRSPLMTAIIMLRAFLVLDPTNLQELIARGRLCWCTDFFRSIAGYKIQCAAHSYVIVYSVNIRIASLWKHIDACLCFVFQSRFPVQGHTAGAGRLTPHSRNTEESELMGSSWQQLNISGWHVGCWADVTFPQVCPLSDLVAHLAPAGTDLCQVLFRGKQKRPIVCR